MNFWRFLPIIHETRADLNVCLNALMNLVDVLPGIFRTLVKVKWRFVICLGPLVSMIWCLILGTVNNVHVKKTAMKCPLPNSKLIRIWMRTNCALIPTLGCTNTCRLSNVMLKDMITGTHLTHCSKSSFFVQKFNFDFPRKLSIFWVKNSWKCCGFRLFSCWQLWFHEKNCQKKFGWKTR